MKILNNIVIICVCIFGCTMSSCEKEKVEFDTQTSISYTLTMSPDLLKFVTPQVTYVDEKGVLVTVTGVEELDNLVLENKAEISGDGYFSSAWTKQTVTGTGYKAWTINMKFRHLDFHSYMGVKYLKNELAEEPEGNNYNFHHSINTSVTAVKYEKTSKGNSITQNQSAYVDSRVTVSLNYNPGDNVESYIDNLVNSPDKAGYYVDPNGDVIRRDDFNL